MTGHQMKLVAIAVVLEAVWAVFMLAVPDGPEKQAALYIIASAAVGWFIGEYVGRNWRRA